MDDLKLKIRTIPDYPKPGIQFRDITSLLADPQAFNDVMDRFVKRYQDEQIDLVVGIESRGFILGAPLALRLGKGFIPVRKEGKLPGPTYGVDYDLEYGTDRVEVHKDAIPPGSKVLMVDDLLATGGTIGGSSRLIEKAGGIIVGYAFLIELVDLKGRNNLDHPIFSLVTFEGE
ncbi:MAG: adenine phosphoribosyltransferase [SAR324 cluster bacterium]|jgi:adenine phosphoribosyltransferase|nr:adenine phosphoribosyltransferase [SAR324 cluster bacterium]MDP6211618.1 adenine phosphoribosyltransferase [SAR324 cluster bacterium]MDP7614722.1 adenine phosphoribosyltransferase [SAR324 cluster bacterium]|tara:strand:- start:409 stop:930 length:522 start_codon:yes stop_codon:yes gene_type:complete